MLALFFVWEEFHDCKDASRKKEIVLSVAVVCKPAHFSSMMFEQAAIELLYLVEQTLTLLIVRLHTESPLFPDCYYHHSRKLFDLRFMTPAKISIVVIPYVTSTQSC